MGGQQGSKTICPALLSCVELAGGTRMPVWGKEILSRREKTLASFLPQWVCRGSCGRGQGSPPLPILGPVSKTEGASMSENWPRPLPPGLGWGWGTRGRGARKLGKAWSRGMTGSAHGGPREALGQSGGSFGAFRVCFSSLWGNFQPNPLPWLALPLDTYVKATWPRTCKGLPASSWVLTAVGKPGPWLRRGACGTTADCKQVVPTEG